MGTPLLVLIQASGMVGLLSADISGFAACFPVIDRLPGAPGRAENCVAFSCVNIVGIWHVAVCALLPLTVPFLLQAASPEWIGTWQAALPHPL